MFPCGRTLFSYCEFTTSMPALGGLPGKGNMAENIGMAIIFHLKDEFLYLMKCCESALSEGEATEIE